MKKIVCFSALLFVNGISAINPDQIDTAEQDSSSCELTMQEQKKLELKEWRKPQKPHYQELTILEQHEQFKRNLQEWNERWEREQKEFWKQVSMQMELELKQPLNLHQ